MLFELPNNTECTLTKFVGRTQKSGKEDVPAVSFRLRLASVSNVMLDKVSKTMRMTAYEAVPGQDQLPGVEITTPILRSKDLKHWAPEDLRCEGWTVIVARGIDDASALQMGTSKIDDFRFDFYEGGFIDMDFRVSTADLDEEGAGMLWGRQERKVFVAVIAPEVPAAPIDGTKAAFEKDHPDATDLFAGPGDDDDDGEGSDPDVDGPRDLEDRLDEALDDDSLEAKEARGEPLWPFPKQGARHEAPPQSATTDSTRTARGRERTEKALVDGAKKAGIKYRDKATGSTWSGRGLQPKWLKVALERGAKLSEFQVGA